MSGELRKELQFVNVEVNRSVAVSSNASVTRAWHDDATQGDCKEFALAKRSRLIDLGWPASALLIAIAHVPSGELHAVLIVVTDDGDLVLDICGMQSSRTNDSAISGLSGCRQTIRCSGSASCRGSGFYPEPLSFCNLRAATDTVQYVVTDAACRISAPATTTP